MDQEWTMDRESVASVDFYLTVPTHWVLENGLTQETRNDDIQPKHFQFSHIKFSANKMLDRGFTIHIE